MHSPSYYLVQKSYPQYEKMKALEKLLVESNILEKDIEKLKQEVVEKS